MDELRLRSVRISYPSCHNLRAVTFGASVVMMKTMMMFGLPNFDEQPKQGLCKLCRFSARAHHEKV